MAQNLKFLIANGHVSRISRVLICNINTPLLSTLAKIRLAWFPNTSISLFIVKTLLLVTDQLDQKKHENVGKTENVDMLCVVGFTI